MIEFKNQLINDFPEYLFNEINHLKLNARQNGRDIIDLGYGNPDLPSHPLVVEKLIEAAQIKKNHKYSVSKGIFGLRKAVAEKYMRNYNLAIDPNKNIVNTIGSKEGLTHLLLSVLNIGDNIVVQDPSYPIHHYAPLVARANTIKIDSLIADDFLNELENELKRSVIKAVLVSFPHNPTTQTVNQEFFDRLVNLAKLYKFLIINDFAYSDIFFENELPPSLLTSDPKLEYSVELYSLTKGYSMAGWRVGFAIGNESAISSLTKLKSYIDYGTFQPIQIASAVALNELDNYPTELSLIYKERREIVTTTLTGLNFSVQESNATMFVWARLPKNFSDSYNFSKELLNEANVAVSPGVGFGERGEGFIRLALVENKNRIRQAMKNLIKFFDNYV
ncbi:MAG: aminotransferase class I/II-fold pyridoxal phosphate-dependent enzyme [Actinomycetota bacterium]|nr:aminotransferase class I/II-fold pyridoxal phosphate-dependent enzyme [Actinomycetota bacterium]MDA3012942.1 aminotransferase class I/II-fold pyridoxal phosphate-dependent enzyme [Actinomycetota bacterium]